MPPSGEKEVRWTLQQIAADIGLYPVEAYVFLQEGLAYTVAKVHGSASKKDTDHHVTGQELCEGLREYALEQWGLMARTVLRRWGISETLDFGKIVFGLVSRKILRTLPEDTIDDFRAVYDFRVAFEAHYRIVSKV